MDAKSIVEKYMAHLHMRRVSGSDASPILPLMMLDVMYSIFNEDIKPVRCRFELKKLKDDWIKTYNRFNGDFFSVFNDDEVDYIVDMMDSFEEYVKNDVMVTKVSVMNLLPSTIDFYTRRILASAQICNVLIQASNVVWDNIYIVRKGSNKHPLLSRMDFLSEKWFNLYYRQNCDEFIDLNRSKTLCEAVDQLCKKMVAWIKETHPEPQN